MMLTDAMRFIIMGAIAVLLFTDHLSIQLLYVFVALYGMMDGLFQPAYAAMRATVFIPEIRNSANALTQIGNQAVRIIGPSLGGLLVSFFSAGWGISLDALTYVVSFICLLLMSKLIPFQPREAAQDGPSNLQSDFKEGLAVLKSNPWLFVTIIAFSFINICFTGIVNVVIPWLFKVHLELTPYVYGIAVTCSGTGAIIAGLLFGARKRWHHRGYLAYGGAFLSGLALLLMSATASPIGLWALFALEGFGIMIFALIWETSMQELVPEEAFGRVASLDMLGSFALLPLGFILVGWLADIIGGIETIALFAGMGILTILCVICIPAVRKFD